MSVKGWMGRSEPFSFVAEGEAASKSNSRRIVRFNDTSRLIKSKKALDFGAMFLAQCPKLNPMFECEVHIDMDIYYASRRPDLDESLVLDLMQGSIYVNDRQVRSRRTRWGLSKDAPRVEVYVRPLEVSDIAGHPRSRINDK